MKKYLLIVIMLFGIISTNVTLLFAAPMELLMTIQLTEMSKPELFGISSLPTETLYASFYYDSSNAYSDYGFTFVDSGYYTFNFSFGNGHWNQSDTTEPLMFQDYSDHMKVSFNNSIGDALIINYGYFPGSGFAMWDTSEYTWYNNGTVNGYATISLQPSVVPEPISSILFIAGGTLLAGRRFIRRKV